jgi:hypothetical protein
MGSASAIKNGILLLLVALVGLLSIIAAIWLSEACDHPSLKTLINETSAGSCFEFWLYRYQTLVTGVAALLAAWLTVWAMQRQTRQARADQADKVLADYTVALGTIIQRYQAVTPVGSHETMQQAERRLRDLDLAAEDPRIQAGMIDSILGGDRRMLALFVNCCRMAARARLYGQQNDLLQHGNLVWPLYIALGDSLSRRRSLLREGQPVSALYSFATIDEREMQRAFVERRIPRLRT